MDRRAPQVVPHDLAISLPRCAGTEAFLSRPKNHFEKYVLPLFLLRPVRCGGCGCRQYRMIFTAAAER